MSQLLASLDDIRVWLPEDKLPVTDATTSKFQVDTYRIIRSQLAGVFTPTLINGWDSPDNTPGIIRSIAGRLISAYLYKEAYSEDIASIPPYAQDLYNEAIALLNAIRTGQLTVVGDDGNPVEDNQLDMGADDFYPNDSAPGPFFSMVQEFA